MYGISITVDVDVVAEMENSIVASCIAYGSPAPLISWSLLPQFSSTLPTELHTSNATVLTDTPASAVHSRQLVDERGVGVVYSSLLLCPAHLGLLVTSLISCTATNGVSGGNSTSVSFLVNVTGTTLYPTAVQ